MTSALPQALLWLFTLNLGVAFGAGVYEHRIVVPTWIRSSRETGSHWDPVTARRGDTGRRVWAFVTTLPLTLLTVANLFVAWRGTARLRDWWLAAGLFALADRVFTFSYFIPTMVKLWGTADSPQAAAAAKRWSNLNYVRHVLVLSAWLAALKTFSLLYAEG